MILRSVEVATDPDYRCPERISESNLEWLISLRTDSCSNSSLIMDYFFDENIRSRSIGANEFACLVPNGTELNLMFVFAQYLVGEQLGPLRRGSPV